MGIKDFFEKNEAYNFLVLKIEEEKLVLSNKISELDYQTKSARIRHFW